MFFKNRNKAAKTRIVHRTSRTDVMGKAGHSPLRSPLATVLETRRFEVNHGEFNGFGSPPGKF